MRHFKILESGIIKSGFFQYSYDPDHGGLRYRTSITVRKFGITKSFEADGSQKIQPEKLESEKYKVVGADIQFANLTGKITSVRGNMAMANVRASDIDASGSGVFDLTGKYAELVSLDANGVVKVPILGKVGFRLILELSERFSLFSKNKTKWPVPDKESAPEEEGEKKE